MDYHFETLSEGRFQKFCQSLLVATYPDVQCLPVGMPDGGRDAFRRKKIRGRSAKYVIFQVKFVREPFGRDAREFIEHVVELEKDKVHELIKRGAKAYYLLTNVSGTSHLAAGTIDKVNEQLSNAFGIDCHCWWRDDLERRLDNHPALKWSFTDVLKATDLLEVLLQKGEERDVKRRNDALRSYMAFQARYDSKLKFKQIELQKDIIDLFVDVPARFLNWKDHSSLEKMVMLYDSDDDPEHFFPYGHSSDFEDIEGPSLGGLQLLVNEGIAKRFGKLVVEGAPGQGKSTVTQYLCQVHRLAFLNQRYDIVRIDQQHRPTALRIPFRIDMRDYASWIAGKDPFSDDPLARVPAGSPPLLESFLAAQVHRYTGASFSVDDLTAIAQQSQILIVLDGFDEVADISLRNRIVAEVSDAATRISANAISAQLIVTSRPAAFANSPGFPREEWQHLQLLPLTRPVIENYANKWLEGRSADGQEKRAVLSLLNEKLSHAHVRDLARNPMQLTILLALISTQGASLPDKRTALYDNYIEIFLNRESEKSRVVRDNRDLLIQIHRYLAWSLQADAETSGAGNIAESNLRDKLKSFLESGGHPVTLVDELFSGMIERVVALVSRVQGTYEFEVQPLREYFAGRYLYDTAPYSPPGDKRRGALPDRFDAIARNFYWLNVARFYAGCYSSGELSSLIDGIDELASSEQFKHIAHVAELGVTLLSDHVFNQHPKLAARLMANIEASRGFHILLAERHWKSDAGVALPPGPAQLALVQKCKAMLEAKSPSDVSRVAAKTIAVNQSAAAVQMYWLNISIRTSNPEEWLRIADDLGIFASLPDKDIYDLYKEFGYKVAENTLRNGRANILNSYPEMWRIILLHILSTNELTHFHFRNYQALHPVGRIVYQLSALLAMHQFIFLDDAQGDWTIYQALLRGAFGIALHNVNDAAEEPVISDDSQVIELEQSFGELFETTFAELRSNPAPFSKFIEIWRKSFGKTWSMYCLAFVAAEFSTKESEDKVDLLDDSISPCIRATAALKNAGALQWWKDQICSTVVCDEIDRRFVALAIYQCMPTDIVIELAEAISELLSMMPLQSWQTLMMSLSQVSVPIATEARRKKLPLKNQMPSNMSPRLACLLMARCSLSEERKLRELYLSNYDGDDSEILRASVRVLIEHSEKKPEIWAKTLPTIRYAYKHGVNYYRYRDSQDTIPLSTAKMVCSKPDEFPLGLVAGAASVLAADTGAAAIPVGKVAARDEWFSGS